MLEYPWSIDTVGVVSSTRLVRCHPHWTHYQSLLRRYEYHCKQHHSSLCQSLLDHADALPCMKHVQDDDVIIHLMDFTDALLSFLQILMVIVYFLPRLLLLFLPVLSYALYVAYQYRPISGELKKLESLQKTPVFVQFAETLQGLATIRSFPNQKQRFVDHFRSAIDGLDNCFLYLWRTHRWLNLRATGIGAVVSGLVASAIVWDILYHQEHGGETTLSSSSAALALTYSITMCDTLTLCVWLYGDVSFTYGLPSHSSSSPYLTCLSRPSMT